MKSQVPDNLNQSPKHNEPGVERAARFGITLFAVMALVNTLIMDCVGDTESTGPQNPPQIEGK